MDEIYPCKACGYAVGQVVGLYSDLEVLCRNCGQSGPIRPTRDAAIAAWNDEQEKERVNV